MTTDVIFSGVANPKTPTLLINDWRLDERVGITAFEFS
jgi:hypothetical protein